MASLSGVQQLYARTPTLSKAQVQYLFLAGLGLLTRSRDNASKQDILAAIRRIHNLPPDTISMVARAHLHIL